MESNTLSLNEKSQAHVDPVYRFQPWIREAVYAVGLHAMSRYFDFDWKSHIAAFGAIALSRTPADIVAHQKCADPQWNYGLGNAASTYFFAFVSVPTLRMLANIRRFNATQSLWASGGLAAMATKFLFFPARKHKLGDADRSEGAKRIGDLMLRPFPCRGGGGKGLAEAAY